MFKSLFSFIATRKTCLSFSLLLLCTACSTIPTNKPLPTLNNATLSQNQSALQQLTAWHLNGKLGIKSDDDGGNLSFDWYQYDQDYRIELSGPLHQGNVQLTDQDGLITLIDAKGKMSHSPNAKALLYSETRLMLPIDELPYWIKGLPAPTNSQAAQENDHAGYPSKLIQGDWTTTYSQYESLNNVYLPTHITLISHDPAHHHLQIKIVVQKWEIPKQN